MMGILVLFAVEAHMAEGVDWADSDHYPAKSLLGPIIEAFTPSDSERAPPLMEALNTSESSSNPRPSEDHKQPCESRDSTNPQNPFDGARKRKTTVMDRLRTDNVVPVFTDTGFVPLEEVFQDDGPQALRPRDYA
jgi:hypothetical protein